jgi:hypothetical protein
LPSGAAGLVKVKKNVSPTEYQLAVGTILEVSHQVTQVGKKITILDDQGTYTVPEDTMRTKIHRVGV